MSCLASASTPLTAQLVDGGRHRLAVDVLHRVVVDAALVADGEDGDDVRVVELGRRLGLVAEAGELPLVEHGGEGQDFSATRRPSETCSAS